MTFWPRTLQHQRSDCVKFLVQQQSVAARGFVAQMVRTAGNIFMYTKKHKHSISVRTSERK